MTTRRVDNRINLFPFERSHFFNYSINMNIKRIFQDIFNWIRIGQIDK